MKQTNLADPVIWHVSRLRNGNYRAWAFTGTIHHIRRYGTYDLFAQEFTRASKGWILATDLKRSTVRHQVKPEALNLV